jgi:phosphoribosylformylglycinamidine synthase
LSYAEIWISEAQERMVLAVPREKVDELLELSRSEDVEATVIGQFGTENRELVLRYQQQEVGRISMQFLHDGIPMPTRKAIVPSQKEAQGFKSLGVFSNVRDHLLKLLAHPNIASKHWIIRQYDHEVQGGSVVKPLTGPLQIGPSDAAVIRPKLNSDKGVVIACGLAPHIADPYAMTIASVDEAIRNAVAVGGDPARMAILDNFCWPSVDDEITMGTLVIACEACRDAALALGIPFISGKDSLHNQFTNQETGQVIRIPRTLLISAIGVIENVRKCITMDLKNPDNELLLIAAKSNELPALAAVHRAMAQAIDKGLIVSCHDVSDGGALVAAAEMCIASGLGLNLENRDADWFAESNGRYVVEARGERVAELEQIISNHAMATFLGRVTPDAKLQVRGEAIEISELTQAWRGTLDW